MRGNNPKNNEIKASFGGDAPEIHHTREEKDYGKDIDENLGDNTSRRVSWTLGHTRPMRSESEIPEAKLSHTELASCLAQCVAWRNATIMEDDVFDDPESVLPHRQAVGYPGLITPGSACYHFLRRTDVPEIHSHTTAERRKANTFTMDLGPVPLNRRDLDTVFGDPDARAVMVFSSEIVGSKDIPVHTCNASAAICQVNKWLLDTGAGQHLVPKKCVPQGAIFQAAKSCASALQTE